MLQFAKLTAVLILVLVLGGEKGLAITTTSSHEPAVAPASPPPSVATGTNMFPSSTLAQEGIYTVYTTATVYLTLGAPDSTLCGITDETAPTPTYRTRLTGSSPAMVYPMTACTEGQQLVSCGPEQLSFGATQQSVYTDITTTERKREASADVPFPIKPGPSDAELANDDGLRRRQNSESSSMIGGTRSVKSTEPVVPQSAVVWCNNKGDWQPESDVSDAIAQVCGIWGDQVFEAGQAVWNTIPMSSGVAKLDMLYAGADAYEITTAQCVEEFSTLMYACNVNNDYIQGGYYLTQGATIYWMMMIDPPVDKQVNRTIFRKRDIQSAQSYAEEAALNLTRAPSLYNSTDRPVLPHEFTIRSCDVSGPELCCANGVAVSTTKAAAATASFCGQLTGANTYFGEGEGLTGTYSYGNVEIFMQIDAFKLLALDQSTCEADISIIYSGCGDEGGLSITAGGVLFSDSAYYLMQTHSTAKRGRKRNRPVPVNDLLEEDVWNALNERRSSSAARYESASISP